MPIRSTTWRAVLPSKPQPRRYHCKSLASIEKALPEVRALLARPHTFRQLFLKFPGLLESELRAVLHRLPLTRDGRYYVMVDAV